MSQSPSPSPNFHQLKRWSVWLMLLLAVALMVLLLIVLAWLKPKDASNKPSAQAQTQVQANGSAKITPSVASVPNSTMMANTGMATTDKPLPQSLQGTAVDGEIIIDENRQLVVTQGLRRLFDYFLSAQGEESLEAIRQRTEDYIRQHTPEPASSQAIALYHRYLDYLQALSQVDSQLNQQRQPINDGTALSMDLGVVAKQLQQVQQLQAKFFDLATRQAFFAQDNALNDYSLQMMTINQNAQITPAERQQRIDQAKQTYINQFSDPKVKAQLQQQQNIEQLLTETQRLQQQGASPQAINAMRRKYVSEEAVQRLEQLDQEQANFENRVQIYQQQRQQLLQQYGNNPQAQQAITTLQQQLFTPEEQLRLDAVIKLEN
ncbi:MULTISPECIES: lipase secretion chaperone [unclassified Moraxella]|uniref:lipase secretion chaperone n=1 Tax=unclassified Moraxella TaxID=2685852 RepID=UPI003AF636A2